MAEKPPSPSDAPEAKSNRAPADAPTGEVVLYAVGNIENGFSNAFLTVLQQILIVAFMVNPVLLGLVMAIKLVWDSVTDPIMAYITDNTRSRWGRRIPYILVGGVSRMIVVVLIVALFPLGDNFLGNEYLQTDKDVEDARKAVHEAHEEVQSAYAGATAEDEARADLEAAHAVLDRVDAEMPETIRVIERNLAERREWAVEGEAGTPEAKATRAKREKIVDNVERRLERARDVLAETEELRVLLEAAEARLDGTLDPALRLRAETLMAELKIRKLNRVLERTPPVLEQWAQRIDELGAGGEALDKDREKILQYGRTRLEEGRKLEAEARVRLALLRDALAEINEGRPDVDSPGIAPINALVAQSELFFPPPTRAEKKGAFAKIAEGWRAFRDPSNAGERHIIVYLIVGCLVFTILSTVQAVPYYALGIELCPSYDGRTKVQVFRSYVDKGIGILIPWMPTICFLTFFDQAVEGLLGLALFFAALGITTTILMSLKVRERTRISTRNKRVNFFKAVVQIMGSWYFWRIFFIYKIIGLVWGIFTIFGFYLNIYWVMGSAADGSRLSGIVGTFAFGISILSLPVAQWASKRFQKHRVVMVAVIGMAVGTILQWWTINPKYPYLQLIQPIFSSTGIVVFYAIMGSMLADVTDADELAHGERREGMYAAVQAFIGKLVAAAVPVLAGLMLAVSGFKAELEYNQTAETILNMRILYSIVPGGLLFLGTLLLFRYPLNRERMVEIKAELNRRHDAEEAAEAAGGA